MQRSAGLLTGAPLHLLQAASLALACLAVFFSSRGSAEPPRGSWTRGSGGTDELDGSTKSGRILGSLHTWSATSPGALATASQQQAWEKIVESLEVLAASAVLRQYPFKRKSYFKDYMTDTTRVGKADTARSNFDLLGQAPLNLSHACASLGVSCSCASDTGGACNVTRLEWGFHRAYVEEDGVATARKWSKSGPFRGFTNLFLVVSHTKVSREAREATLLNVREIQRRVDSRKH